MKKIVDPRMHSAEHILNQTMDRMFHSGRCFSAHIEKKKSKCDYRFDRALTQNEVEEIQTRVNQVIQEDLPVTESYITRAEAGQRYHMGKLPPDAGDRIRIISMGHYDACPCIGPHVNSTSQIGAFRITTTSFEDGVLRIRFKVARTEHQ